MIAIERSPCLQTNARRGSPRFSSLSGCLSFFRLGCSTRRDSAGFFIAILRSFGRSPLRPRVALAELR
ncbi:hypothetical protein C0Z18_09380 [Trinickia dabaoshanensis]|uniref:Uncharacterized protein n=1 Tax=Trinickia dabaoshanensis TaxID=564714 RepID=A0A2N7VUB6_9BURK|nr:hypothetical protein C0Z18_09380 [Trinickia dabaoshanensis]